MTFDEAIEKIESITDELNIRQEVINDIVSVVEGLRKEYAPTVEMTQRQYHSFKLWKYHTAGWNMTNCAEWARDEHLKASEAMEAWLHPETIKVVDE